MNQLGTTLLYLSHLFHSIQLSLSNRTAKDQLRFIHWTSYAPNLIHKSSSNRTSDWLYSEFSCLYGQNSQKRNDLTSILVVDFFTETGQLKMVFYQVAFLYIDKEILLYFKIYGVSLFCPHIRFISRSPQLSPCHNRAQITLTSKQDDFQAWWILLFFSLFRYLKQ